MFLDICNYYYCYHYCCCCFLNKCPAFECFNNKIFLRRQWFIAICTAGLRTSLIQITIQPQTKTTTIEIAKKKTTLIFHKLGYKRSKRKATKLHPKDTYSPAPIDKLSTLPLMKYKFSPVQWNTLKLGLNLYKSDSPVP